MDENSKIDTTAFDRVTYEDFMSIYRVISAYANLDDKQKEQILLMIDGLRYRSMQQEHKYQTKSNHAHRKV